MFKEIPQFIPTLLSDPKYANVTGGQRVEIVSLGGDVIFYSAVKAVSNLVTAVRLETAPHPWDTLLTATLRISFSLEEKVL